MTKTLILEARIFNYRQMILRVLRKTKMSMKKMIKLRKNLRRSLHEAGLRWLSG